MDQLIDLDVNGMRDPAIGLYGLPAIDKGRTFYYDETNNHRLVRTVEGGLNVADPRPFVLGGSVHESDQKAINMPGLKQAMHVQDNGELKFGQIASGNFMTILNLRRLQPFFSWTAQQGHLIHFITVDPVYY